MTLPPFTRRGFWTRIIVVGAGLLLWIMRFMVREGSLIGIVLFSFWLSSASPDLSRPCGADRPGARGNVALRHEAWGGALLRVT